MQRGAKFIINHRKKKHMKAKEKVIEGMTFKNETPDEVCRILVNACNGTRERLKIYYGDTDTGRDWMEEHNTQGYIGRSTGTSKIPLMIHNSRSIGGGGILDHCIVKIKDIKTGRVLYQHPEYHQGKIEITKAVHVPYSHAIEINGEIYSRHMNIRSAQMLRAKLA